MRKQKPGDHHYQPDVKGATRVGKNEDNTLDEIVIADPKSFHLEQMDTGVWWLRVGLDKDGPHGNAERSVVINLWSKAAIYARAEDD
jgi:hypothetical protein